MLNQIALEFRLLSIPFTFEAFDSNRNLRSPGVGQQQSRWLVAVAPSDEKQAIRSKPTLWNSERLSPLFYPRGSQFNRDAAVAVGVVDSADDRWLIELNCDMPSGSE